MPGSIEILPLELATFTFAEDEPDAGDEGVVVGFAVRHQSGVLLFDTGFGFGSREVDDRYHPRSRRVVDALAEVGLRAADISAVANCHLHIDHAGQNSTFPDVPIHVQRAEWEVAHRTEHTLLEWIDFERADYRLHDGDYQMVPGIRALATPGHTPGHQSIVVELPEGSVVLAGQAVYSAGEWDGDAAAREGRSRAPDQAAYDRSLQRLRDINPVRVHFAHDRTVWLSR